MKFIKILPFFLSLVLLISPLFSQETGGNSNDLTSSADKSEEQDKKAGLTSVSDEMKSSDTSSEAAAGEISSDAAQVEKKEPEKARVVRKVPSQTEKKESPKDAVKVEQTSTDDDSTLLRVDEGSFKYVRIPDIVIDEIKPVYAASEVSKEEVLPVNENPDERGFLGMKKQTADVVAKGGILLLILVIFILYKSRMKGTRKRGPGRNVLNSYRK